MSYELKLLDFPQVQKLLAAYTHTSYGKEAAMALEPAPTLAVAQAMQDSVSVAKELVEKDDCPTFPDLQNIRPALRQANSIGSTLNLSAFSNIRLTLQFAQSLGLFVNQHHKLLPESQRLDIPQVLVEQIDRLIDEQRSVRDDASEQMSSLIHDYQAGRKKLQTCLYEEVAKLNKRDCLDTHSPVYWQGERGVLVVRPKCIEEIKGVRRGNSGMGENQMIEPIVAVALNNELEKLAGKISAEQQRLLRGLTDKVREHISCLNQVLDAITWVDLALAGGKLSMAWGAQAPKLLNDPGVRLESVYHPLLLTQYLRGEIAEPVPLSIDLDDQQRFLLVTGPNTGGKTVALKTLGLVVLMALSGLHIPARGRCEIGWYESLLVDLGDRQSMYHQLSTFAGHVESIMRILEQADAKSLLLMDELGTGTDPDEGAALAMGLLDELQSREAQGIVNSHLTPLKKYVEKQSYINNACMSFDTQTLSPGYHLLIGKSGESLGLTIAAKIGLDGQIVEAAKAYLKQIKSH